ncbi:MAG: hypothetical protein ABIK96_07685 [bacterium]
MTDKDKALGWLTDFGVTIHEILRYGYGGLLAFLVAALVEPANTKTVVDSLGTTISVLLAFAAGGAIYAGHRPVIGELLYLLHEKVHVCLSRNASGYTCRSAYFVNKWNLSLPLATEAFRTVRDDAAFDQTKQRRFYLQHSELHMLYVTFFVLALGACIMFIRDPVGALVSGWTLLVVALFALVSGFVGNILLCRQECKTMLLVPEDIIRELLMKAQFLAPAVGVQGSAEQAHAAGRPSDGR